MPQSIATRLTELGISLPQPPAPVASYVGFVRQGNLVFVSGQLPLVDGKLITTGLLGRDVTLEQGIEAARICAVNILAQVNVACDGDLDRVQHCVRLGGFVASMPDFTDHPKVINGASELMADIFGKNGQHARAAVGVAALPMNACVEIEGLFATD
jgi:enamine deaminase RidA (YjgF/YER057c/UK114 family)